MKTIESIDHTVIRRYQEFLVALYSGTKERTYIRHVIDLIHKHKVDPRVLTVLVIMEHLKEDQDKERISSINPELYRNYQWIAIPPDQSTAFSVLRGLFSYANSRARNRAVRELLGLSNWRKLWNAKVIRLKPYEFPLLKRIKKFFNGLFNKKH